MKLDKSIKRDNARRKAKNGMRITGKSIFIILETIVKKGKDSNKDNGKRKRKKNRH